MSQDVGKILQYKISLELLSHTCSVLYARQKGEKESQRRIAKLSIPFFIKSFLMISKKNLTARTIFEFNHFSPE